MSTVIGLRFNNMSVSDLLFPLVFVEQQQQQQTVQSKAIMKSKIRNPATAETVYMTMSMRVNLGPDAPLSFKVGI